MILNRNIWNWFSNRTEKSRNEYLEVADAIRENGNRTNKLLAEAFELIEDAKEEIIKLRKENAELRQNAKHNEKRIYNSPHNPYRYY